MFSGICRVLRIETHDECDRQWLKVWNFQEQFVANAMLPMSNSLSKVDHTAPSCDERCFHTNPNTEDSFLIQVGVAELEMG